MLAGRAFACLQPCSRVQDLTPSVVCILLRSDFCVAIFWAQFFQNVFEAKRPLRRV
jgi:hypothetical protein